MIISVNWLKQFVPIDRPIDELVALIGSRLVEVEEVIDLGAKYQGIIVAQAKKVTPHPNADRLKVVMIDDGRAHSDVERDADGLVQVVCGAPNVQEGMLVAWLPPGAMVPASFSDAEPFVLEARPLRGIKSNGMLASAKELAIGDNHDGIVAIDKQVAPGAPFAEAYELNDYLLDIENKSLTHRPDSFGLIGFAREIAAIQGLQFTTPTWFTMLEPILAGKTPSDKAEPTVTIASPDICERYQAVVLANVDAAMQSPLQVQSYLSRVGVRPISAVVDVTNYLMLLTGQPLHAFDYDKFVAASSTGKPDVVVRTGHDGEKLELLDGRTITLTSEDIVIAAGETPVALGGAMGGASTEISSDTKNVLLEAASFNLYNLRATQMRHGIFSEAITRFTKGQPAPITAPVLASAIRMLTDFTGAKRVSEVIDIYPQPESTRILRPQLQKINAVLGTDLSLEAAATPLQHAEFIATPEGDKLIVAVPYWRKDIAIDEDVIEEIGRVLGYDTIIPQLPLRTYRAVHPEPFDQFKQGLRQRLTSAGANELLTYSFVHGKVLEHAGQDAAQAFRITNAISPELQYYRLSLTPSLLTKVHPNSKQGFDYFALYEINKVHQKGMMDTTEPEVPAEYSRLALTLAASKKTAALKGSAYYQAKYFLEFLLKGQKLSFEPLASNDSPLAAPFQVGRSATVLMAGQPIGVVGEYTAAAQKNFKLPTYAAGFELDLDVLYKNYTFMQEFTPPPRFQGTEKDVCVQVAPDRSYAEVAAVVQSALKDSPFQWQLSPLDMYQPADAAYKNITVHLTLHDPIKTIDLEEVKQLITAIETAVDKQLQAKIV
ncbi:MAG TPA: phenylalanine--tRNA ligase subunit beta [Verrucomicrobiae bacterium]|nr:phenylalanine--tRNA ligase subunit beta [Verrucomicrobiae bacterium]